MRNGNNDENTGAGPVTVESEETLKKNSGRLKKISSKLNELRKTKNFPRRRSKRSETAGIAGYCRNFRYTDTPPPDFAVVLEPEVSMRMLLPVQVAAMNRRVGDECVSFEQGYGNNYIALNHAGPC